MVPLVMRWLPTMARMRVVLPHPEGPSSPVMLPLSRVKDVVFGAGDMEVSDFHRGGGSCTHTTTIIQQVLNLQGL